MNQEPDQGRLWKPRRQAITWTNADSFPIGPLRTNISEIQI